MVNPKPHTEYLIGGKKKVFYYCGKCDCHGDEVEE